MRFHGNLKRFFLRGIPGLALAVFTLVAIAAPAIAAAPESAAPRELVRSVKDAVAKKEPEALKAVSAQVQATISAAGSEKDTAVLVVASSALLRALLDAGAFAEARGLAQAILSGRKAGAQPKDSVSAAAINALGEVDFEAGDIKSAQSRFEAARDLREAIHGPKHASVAESLNNIGAALQAQGKFREARSNYQRSLTIREAVLPKGHRDIGESLNNLATLALASANYSEAELMFKRAISLWEITEGKDALVTADGLNNLGELYRDMGDTDRARPLLERALKIRTAKLGARSQPVAESLNNLALLAERAGDLQEAEAQYRRSLELMAELGGSKQQSYTQAQNNLGVLLTRAGALDAALPLLKSALSARRESQGGDSVVAARSMDNLARWHLKRGQVGEARALLGEALSIVDSSDNPDALWRVLENILQLERKSGNSEAAILFGKRAVNTLQSMRQDMASMESSLRQSFVRDKSDLYRQLFDLLVASGRLSEAQQVLRMMKEEEYFDFIRRQGSSDPRTAKMELTATESAVVESSEGVSRGVAKSGVELKRLRAKPVRTADEERRLLELAAEVNTARSAFNLAVADIQRSFAGPNVASRRAQEIGAMNLGALRALQGTLQELGEGAVLVHYVVQESRIHILLTTPAIQIARRVDVDRTQLNLRVQQLREKLESPRRNPEEAAKRVYDLVIAPIADDLAAANASTLLLSLDGVLRYVPFAALHDGKTYLVEKYRTVLFSEAARDKLKDKREESWRVAGMGLSSSVENFPALPSVVEELRGIVRTKENPTGTVPGTIALNQAFSRKALVAALNGGYSVLHLASHFVLRAGVERDSFLLLGDKTRLTLREMREEDYDFRQVDLVALSACETAIGGQADQFGLEVEGLSAQVQNQGAKGVLATLWRVHDESTAIVMQQFYRLRVEGKLSKAEALRQAQTSLLGIQTSGSPQSVANRGPKIRNAAESDRRFRHPFFWAPFVLAGNWR